MGIQEREYLSQNPDYKENSSQLPAAAESIQRETARQKANDELAKLMVQTQNNDKLLWYLRQSGVWVWLAGDNKDMLGINAKKEHGRDYDAFMTVTFAPEGAVADMVFEHDGQSWADHIDASREVPEVMLAVLEDIEKIERTLSWTRYHNQTSDSRYVTNLGPGISPPR